MRGLTVLPLAIGLLLSLLLVVQHIHAKSASSDLENEFGIAGNQAIESIENSQPLGSNRVVRAVDESNAKVDDDPKKKKKRERKVKKDQNRNKQGRNENQGKDAAEQKPKKSNNRRKGDEDRKRPVRGRKEGKRPDTVKKQGKNGGELVKKNRKRGENAPKREGKKDEGKGGKMDQGKGEKKDQRRGRKKNQINGGKKNPETGRKKDQEIGRKKDQRKESKKNQENGGKKNPERGGKKDQEKEGKNVQGKGRKENQENGGKKNPEKGGKKDQEKEGKNGQGKRGKKNQENGGKKNPERGGKRQQKKDENKNHKKQTGHRKGDGKNGNVEQVKPKRTQEGKDKKDNPRKDRQKEKDGRRKDHKKNSAKTKDGGGRQNNRSGGKKKKDDLKRTNKNQNKNLKEEKKRKHDGSKKEQKGDKGKTKKEGHGKTKKNQNRGRNLSEDKKGDKRKKERGEKASRKQVAKQKNPKDKKTRKQDKATSKKKKEKPKRKPKQKCVAKKKCTKAKGKCRKIKWTEKKPEKCVNRIDNACKNKPRAKCVCCLSKSCKKYAKAKCLKKGGKGKQISKCKKDKRDNLAYGNDCTCCYPCKTKKSCTKRKGECGKDCKNGVVSGGKCGGKGCLCCKKGKTKPTIKPTPPTKPTIGPDTKPTIGPEPPTKPTIGPNPPTNPPKTPNPTLNPPTPQSPPPTPLTEPEPVTTPGPQPSTSITGGSNETSVTNQSPEVTNSSSGSANTSKPDGSSSQGGSSPTVDPSIQIGSTPNNALTSPGSSGPLANSSVSGGSNATGGSASPVVSVTAGDATNTLASVIPGSSSQPVGSSPQGNSTQLGGSTPIGNTAQTGGPTTPGDSTPQGTTTAAPTSSSRQIIQSLQDLANGLKDLSKAGQAAGGKRKRSLKDVEQVRNKRQTVTVITKTVIVQIQVKVTRYFVRRSTLTTDEISSIDSTTSEIKQLTEEVKAGTKTVDAQVLRLVNSATKGTLKLFGDLNAEAKNEEKSAALQEKKEVSVKISSTLVTMSSSMGDLVNAVTSNAGSTSGGSSATVMKVITEITSKIKTITKSTVNAMTESMSTSLTQLLAQLQEAITSVQSGSVSISTEEVQRITTAADTVKSASEIAPSITADIESQAESQKQAAALLSLEQSMITVKSSIQSIEAAIAKQIQSTATVQKFTINAVIIQTMTAISSAIESVKMEQIDIISGFAIDADEIIAAFENGPVEIEGFEALKTASSKLSTQVTMTKEESAAEDVISEKMDTIESLEYLISEIIFVTKEIKDATQQNQPTEDKNEVTVVTDFLKSLTTSDFTESSVIILETHLSTLETLMQSVTDKGIQGLDTLIQEGEKQQEALTKEIESYMEKEDQLKQVKKAEETTKLMMDVQQAVKELNSKVVAESNTENVETIETLASNLQVLMKVVVSKTEKLTEEKVSEIQDTLATFTKEVESLINVKSVSNLKELTLVTKKAVEKTKAEEKLLKQTTESEQKLEVMDITLILLQDIEEFVKELTAITTSINKFEDITVTEMTSEIESMKASSLTLNQYNSLSGKFENLKLLTSEDEVDGLDDMLTKITKVKTDIGNEITREEATAESSKAAVLLDESATLLSVGESLIFEISDIISEASDASPAISSTEIEKLITISFTIMEKKISITQEDVEELNSTVVSLEGLLQAYKDGTSKSSLSNLDEGLSELDFVMAVVEQEIRKAEQAESAVTLLQSIETKVAEIAILFEEITISIQTGEQVTEETIIIIDDIVNFFIKIQDEYFVATEDDVISLESLKSDLEVYVNSFTGSEKFTGADYTLEDAKAQANSTSEIVQTTLKEKESLEESSSELDKFDDISLYTGKIVSILKQITSFTEVDTSNDVTFTEAKTALEAISNDVSSIKSTNELEKIVKDLMIAVKTEKTSTEAEAALATAEAADDAIMAEVKKLEEKKNAQEVINKVGKALSVVTYFTDEMQVAIEKLQTSQLIGEDDADFDEFTQFMEMMSENVDSLSEDDIDNIEELSFTLIQKVYDLESDKSIGNILNAQKTAQNAKDSAELRLEGQIDSNSFEEDLESITKLESIVIDIEKQVISMIETIEGADITGDAAGDLTQVITVMEKISSSEATEEELQNALTTLKETTAENGKEIIGIYRLKDVAEQSVKEIKSQKESLVSVSKSRERINILSSLTTKLSDIKDDLSSIEEYFLAAQTSENSTPDTNEAKAKTIIVFKSLESVLKGASDTEKVDSNILNELDDILDELYYVYEETNVELAAIKSLISKTQTVEESTNVSLKEFEVLSEKKATESTLKEAKTTLLKAEEVLTKLTEDIGTPVGNPIEDADIAQLDSIFKEIFGTKEVKKATVKEIKKIIKKIEAIEITEGQDFTSLKSAMDGVKSATDIVTTELMSITSSFKQASTAAVFKETSSVMSMITSAIDKLQADIGLALGEEVNDPIVDRLTDLLQKSSTTSVTLEQLTEIKEALSTFESTKAIKNKGIKGLGKLKALSVSKTSELKESEGTLNQGSNVEEKITVYAGIQSAITSIKGELENVQEATSEANEFPMFKELLGSISEDVTTMTKETLKMIEEFLFSITTLSSVIKVTKSTKEQLTASIANLEEATSKQLFILEKSSAKASKTSTLMEAVSLFEKVQTTVKNIVTAVQSTEFNKDININEIISLMSTFESNPSGISKESLMMFEEKTAQLSSILARKQAVSGMDTLLTITEKVIQNTYTEIRVIKEEVIREEAMVVRKQAEEAVANSTQIFQMISEKVGDVTDSSTNETVYELQQIVEILAKFEKGIATLLDVEQYISYTSTLKDTEFTTGVTLIGLDSALKSSTYLVDKLSQDVLEDEFYGEYSSTVTAKKEVLSLVNEARTSLETLKNKQGKGTETFTGDESVIKNLEIKIAKATDETSGSFIRSLAEDVNMLKMLSENVTDGMAIEGVDYLVMKVRSTESSLSSSISESLSIKESSDTVSILEEAESLFVDMKNIFQRIDKKTGSQSSSGTLDAAIIKDIKTFMEDSKIMYTKEDLVIIQEYVQVMHMIEEIVTTETILGYEDIKTLVEENSLSLSKELTKAKITEREEQQTVLASKAKNTIDSSYSTFASFSDTSGDLQEIKEVTELSMMLQTVDFSTLSIEEISKISESISIAQAAIEASGSTSVAYGTFVAEQMAQFSYGATKQIEKKKYLENAKKSVDILTKSKESFDSLSSSIKRIMKDMTTNSVEFEEVEVINNAYNLLMDYANDPSTLDDQFSLRIKEFDFSSVTATANKGIKYLSQVSNLIEKFSNLEQQSAESIKTAEYTGLIESVKGSVTTFTRNLEMFLNEVESEGSTDDGTAQPTDGMEDVSQEDAVVLFDSIMEMISGPFFNTGKFTEEFIIELSQLIQKFTQSDFKMELKSVDKNVVKELISEASSATEKMSKAVQRMDSVISTQESFGNTQEASALMMSLEESIKILADTGKGSTKAPSIILELEGFFKTYKTASAFTSDIVSTLRSLTYDLQEALIGEETVTFDTLKEEVRTISNDIQKSEAIQSSFVSSIQSSSSMSQSFSSSSASSSSYSMQIKAKKELLQQEILRTSQQYYIMQSSSALFVDAKNAFESIKGTASSSGGDSGQTPGTAGNSDVLDEDLGTFDPKISNGNEIESILTRLSTMFKASGTKIEEISSSFLTSFASDVNRLKVISASEDFLINVEKLDSALESLSNTEQMFSDTVNSLGAYAQASQSVLTYQEVTKVVDDVSMFFQNVSEKLGSKSDGSELSENTKKYMEYITTITGLLIGLSTQTIKVNEDFLIQFKSAFMELRDFELGENEYVANFHIWKQLLMNPKIPVTQILQKSTDEGAMVRAQTQEYVFNSEKAITVLDKFTISINEIKDALTGSSKSNSTSRLEKIIDESLIIADEIANGMLSASQIAKMEGYTKELSQLRVVLKDSSSIDKFDMISKSLSSAQDSVANSKMMAESWKVVDEKNEILDKVFYFSSQMSDFVQIPASQMLDFVEEVIVTEVEDILKAVGNISLSSYDDADSILSQINATGFIMAIQNVEPGKMIKQFKKLSGLFEDLAMESQTMRRISTFNEAMNTAGSMMRAIPSIIGSDASSPLRAVSEISAFSVQLDQLKQRAYIMTTNDIREISKQENMIRYAISQYGSEIAYLKVMKQNLAFFKYSFQNYEGYAMNSFINERANRILGESSEIIESTGSYLYQLFLNAMAESTYEEVDNVKDAFDYMLSFASNLELLPNDLGEKLQEYRLNETEYESGKGIKYLKEVSSMMTQLKESYQQSKMLSTYYNEIDSTLKVSAAVNSISNTLQSFMSVNDISNQTTDSPSGENNTESETKSPQELLDDLKRIIKLMYNNGTILAEKDIVELEGYTNMLQTVTLEEGALLENLSGLITQFSSLSGELSLASQAQQSAAQFTESYNLFKSITVMNYLITSSLEKMEKDGGSSTAQGTIDNIKDCYTNFTKGYSYLKRGIIGKCMAYANELSSSSVESGSSIDASELRNVMESAAMELDEYYGFVSAQAHHYELLSMGMDDGIYDMEFVSFMQSLGRSSEVTYVLHELNYEFADLTNNLTSLGDISGNGVENDTLLIDIQSLLQITDDVSNIQIGMLSMFRQLIEEIEGRVESAISVNATELTAVKEMLQSTQGSLGNRSEILGDYGFASTRALVLRDAADYLEYMNNETMMMIKMFEGGNNGTGDNSTSDSGTTSNSNSTRMVLIDLSDILIHWTFDRESVNARSVASLKNSMFMLQRKSLSNGSKIEESHMLKYSLHEANRTVSDLISEVYYEAALQRASLEEAIYRYSRASLELEEFKTAIGNLTGGDEGTTGSSNDTTENEVKARLQDIDESSLLILSGWKDVKQIEDYEISNIRSYQKELSDLSRTEEAMMMEGEMFRNLTLAINEAASATNSSFKALSNYSQEVYEKATNIFYRTFFEEIKSLANYSSEYLANKTVEDDSSDSTESSSPSSNSTRSSSSLSSSTTVAVSSTPSGNSSSNETDYCARNDSLSCKAYHLLTAIENANSSKENDSTTSQATTTTEASSSSESTQDADFMMGESGEIFKFEGVRQFVYNFMKAMQYVSNDDLMEKHWTIDILEEVVKLSDNLINEYGQLAESVTLSDVEEYYVPQQDVFQKR